MATTETNDWLIRFHIGRGGRFNNSGYKTYVGRVDGLSDCFGDKVEVIDTDEEGNILPDDEWKLIGVNNGNVYLTGRDSIESETGVVDWDGDYDADIVRRLDDCTDDEYRLIYKSEGEEAFPDEEIYPYVCSRLGKLYVAHSADIKVYPPYMEVFTQDGCERLYKEDFEVRNESEARESLADMQFTPDSIDRIIDVMEIYEWLLDEDDE